MTQYPIYKKRAAGKKSTYTRPLNPLPRYYGKAQPAVGQQSGTISRDLNKKKKGRLERETHGAASGSQPQPSRGEGSLIPLID